MRSDSSVFKPTWSLWTCGMPSYRTLLKRLPKWLNSKKWTGRLKRYWWVSCLSSILDVSGIRPLQKHCGRVPKKRLLRNQLEGRPWSGSKLPNCSFVTQRFCVFIRSISPSRELQLQSTPSARTVSKGPGNDAPCMSTNFLTIPSILVRLSSGTCTLTWNPNTLTWLRVDLWLHQSSYRGSTPIALDECGIQQQTSEHFGNAFH